MRELMRATNQLWETDADLGAAERLFEPDDTRIREGITRIVDFLGELTNEYEQCVDDLSSDDGSGTTLEKGPHVLTCSDGMRTAALRRLHDVTLRGHHQPCSTGCVQPAASPVFARPEHRRLIEQNDTEDTQESATRHEHRCRRSTTFTLPRLMP